MLLYLHYASIMHIFDWKLESRLWTRELQPMFVLNKVSCTIQQRVNILMKKLVNFSLFSFWGQTWYHIKSYKLRHKIMKNKNLSSRTQEMQFFRLFLSLSKKTQLSSFCIVESSWLNLRKIRFNRKKMKIHDLCENLFSSFSCFCCASHQRPELYRKCHRL